MDVIGLLVNVVSGAVGGNISGAALKEKSLGAIGNTVAGAIGGTAGAYILKAVDVLSSAGLADMSVSAMATEAGAAAVFGAIVTAVVGYVKGMMGK